MDWSEWVGDGLANDVRRLDVDVFTPGSHVSVGSIRHAGDAIDESCHLERQPERN